MTLRNTSLFLLLFFATCLSGWSIFLSSHTHFSISNNGSNTPDVLMEGVIATIMNPLGKPSLKIESNHVTHYAENDSTEFASPQVTIYRESPQPWYINSDHAKSKQGLAEITFWDNVIIHHLADRDNPLTTMRTSSLTLIPDQQIAKTAEAISVTQPDTLINAVGMLANWEEGTVKLLSQAREEYVPSS